MEKGLEINNEVVLDDKMMRARWKGILKIEQIETACWWTKGEFQGRAKIPCLFIQLTNIYWEPTVFQAHFKMRDEQK